MNFTENHDNGDRIHGNTLVAVKRSRDIIMGSDVWAARSRMAAAV